mmetsp:Transcript_104167/g.324849  ORF Transcript_104167/g.324849 Transcript_104167/m.324849 type:complete len:214 (-) Transcript_104167:469-1110(-)
MWARTWTSGTGIGAPWTRRPTTTRCGTRPPSSSPSWRVSQTTTLGIGAACRPTHGSPLCWRWQLRPARTSSPGTGATRGRWCPAPPWAGSISSSSATTRPASASAATSRWRSSKSSRWRSCSSRRLIGVPTSGPWTSRRSTLSATPSKSSPAPTATTGTSGAPSLILGAMAETPTTRCALNAMTRTTRRCLTHAASTAHTSNSSTASAKPRAS